MSASADGKRLTFIRGTGQAQAYVGELPARGTRMNPPRRLTNDEGNDLPIAWTPDSRAVLFQSDRSGGWGLFKQEMDEENAELLVAGPQGAAWPCVSADGAWILYQEQPKTALGSAPVALLRIPVKGGMPQRVLEMRNDSDCACAGAPASLCVLREVSQNENQMALIAFDPLKGRGKVLRTIERANWNWVFGGLSPDGSTSALSRGGEAETHIRFLSLSGGSDREKTVKGWPNPRVLVWSPDGKGLYIGSGSSAFGSSALLYVDLKGAAHVLWQDKGASGEIWGVPSPDGRYLAIKREVANNNVWMLEGF